MLFALRPAQADSRGVLLGDCRSEHVDSGASTIPPPPIERCTCQCDTDTLKVDGDPELGHHEHGCKCEVHARLHCTV